MHLWLSICLRSGSWEWGEQNGEGNGETAWCSRETERVECRAGWGWGEEGKIWNKTVVSPTFASHGLLLCPSGGPLWIRNVTSPCSGGCTARFSVIDDNISLLQIAFNNTEIYFSQAHQRLSLPLFVIIWREDTEYSLLIASSVLAPRSFSQSEFYVGNSDRIISKPLHCSHSLYDR